MFGKYSIIRINDSEWKGISMEQMYIHDQTDDFIVEGKRMADISLGIGNVADNGCGVIAAYNVLRAIGKSVTFTQVKKDIIKKLGLNAGGLLGINTFSLRRYIKSRCSGVWYSKQNDAVWIENSRQAKAVIILVRWKKSLMLHYISGIKSGGEYIFYNSGIWDEDGVCVDGRKLTMEAFLSYVRVQGATPLWILGVNNEICLLKVSDEAQLKRNMNIRRQVFTIEKNVSETIEVDEYDCLNGECEHFVAIYGDTDIGAARCKKLSEKTVKLQRFCILKVYRDKGLGRELIGKMEAYYKDKGIETVVLDSKYNVREFYAGCGYVEVSEVFVEADVEHVRMKKRLE